MNLFSIISALLLTAQLVAPPLVVFQQGILGDSLDTILRHEQENRIFELNSVYMFVLVHEVVQLGPHHQAQFITENLLRSIR